MPTVKLREGDTFEGAIRRFKRMIDKARILQKSKDNQYHTKDSVLKQREKAAAKKRWLKKLARDKSNLRLVSRHSRPTGFMVNKNQKDAKPSQQAKESSASKESTDK